MNLSPSTVLGPGEATSAPGWTLSATAEQEERRLRQAVANYLSPAATFDFVWVERSPNNHFLGVVVPPSPRSPHAVTSPSGEVGRRSDIRFATAPTPCG